LELGKYFSAANKNSGPIIQGRAEKRLDLGGKFFSLKILKRKVLNRYCQSVDIIVELNAKYIRSLLKSASGIREYISKLSQQDIVERLSLPAHAVRGGNAKEFLFGVDISICVGVYQ